MTSKKQLPLFVGLASLLVAGVVLSLTYTYIKHLARQRFDGEVAKVRQSFIEKTTASELLANNLQTFAQIDPDMPREHFQSLVEGLMTNYRFVRSANFYRYVAGPDREQHEIWLSQHTDAHELVDSSSDDPDTTVPAAEKPWYLSLIYADLRSADNTVYGWNVLSDQRRQGALLKAMESSKADGSDGFLLDDGHAATEVFVPFYRNGKIPVDAKTRLEHIAGVIGMTIDLPQLLGDEEWRRNVTVMLSTSLADSKRLRDLYRSLDKEAEGVLHLGTMETEVDLESFGQNMRLLFVKDLYFSRMNYAIFLLVAGGCLVVTGLAVHLARTLLNLAALNASLEQKVAERTRDLTTSNAKIQEILDKLDDGILIMDKTLQIDAGFSRATPGILGVEDLTGRSVWDLIFSQLDPHKEDAAKHNFTLPLIFESDEFQWSISHDNLLRSMVYQRSRGDGTVEQRQLSLRYAPLYDEQGHIQRILLVISDVTEVLALRRIVEESRQQNSQRMQLVMEILQADRQALQSFISEGDTRAGTMRDLMKLLQHRLSVKDLQALFREVHTFKGNARLLKLQSLSRTAHELEDEHAEVALSGQLDTASGETLMQSMQGLMQLFENYRAVFQELFGNHDVVDRSVELRREWMDVLRSGFSSKTLTHLLENQNNGEIFSFADIWKSYQGMVDDIAGQLAKQVKPLRIQGNIYLKGPLQTPIKDALTHLLRNALDHGIETPEQRQEAGKTVEADIWVTLSLHDDEALLEIHDDGRGVDSDRVWQLAQDRGLVAKGARQPTHADVWELLFHPGFSTKAAASDISGRGVGLDAVRSFLAEFGCRVDMYSHLGQGTSFRLVIPLNWVSAMWNESGTLWDQQNIRVVRAS